MYDILLVDDEDKTRSSLKKNYPWEALGFRIAAEASDGREALAILKESAPDVILTDIVMPDMTGIELARHIHEMDIHAKIVFLSGYREFDYAQQALSYGVFRYLLKPISSRELIGVFGVLRSFLDNDSGRPNAERSADGIYEKLVADVKAYIEEDLANASLQGAAERVFLSMPYLSRLFKSQNGTSFSEHLAGRKMKRAKNLLLDRRNMIYEIASALGYDSAKNFSRAFKKYYGFTPQEFRQSPHAAPEPGLEKETGQGVMP